MLCPFLLFRDPKVALVLEPFRFRHRDEFFLVYDLSPPDRLVDTDCFLGGVSLPETSLSPFEI